MDTVFLALRVVVSLAVVVGAIWFVQRRVGRGAWGKSKSKPISVVARQSVGAKASIAVVEVGGKRYVLGVTEHAVSVIDSTEVTVEETAAEAAELVAVEPEPATERGDFADALSRAEGRPVPAREPALVTPALAKPATSRLAGSVLSASTWKQAFTALRGER